MIRVAVESSVYQISKKDFEEAQKHLSDRYANDTEWGAGLNTIIKKGKYLYTLDGNYNY